MAKSQKKSKREARKPKAEKVKTNAANPSTKSGVVAGLDNMKNNRSNYGLTLKLPNERPTKMRLKAAICREQEARQLALSISDPLESRRKIAARAAKVWGQEAIEAEKREAGYVQPQDKADANITREFAEEAEAEKSNHAG